MMRHKEHSTVEQGQPHTREHREITDPGENQELYEETGVHGFPCRPHFWHTSLVGCKAGYSLGHFHPGLFASCCCSCANGGGSPIGGYERSSLSSVAAVRFSFMVHVATSSRTLPKAAQAYMEMGYAALPYPYRCRVFFVFVRVRVGGCFGRIENPTPFYGRVLSPKRSTDFLLDT